LAFHDKEVYRGNAEEKTAGEDVSIAEINVSDDEGCEEGEEEVPY